MDYRLQEMLAELESARLEVMLVPVNRNARCWTGEHSMKRVVSSVPVKWYREMCRRHPSSRGVRRAKFDTRIRRLNVLRLLKRLVDGKPVWSKYADELRRVAERRAG